MKKLIPLLLAILVYAPLAHAQEENGGTLPKLEGKVYSPEYCSFTALFPEEPYITKQCENEAEESCYNLISYTKVFEGLSATVNVEIICNPSTPDFYNQFSPEVMKSTVQAMTEDIVIEAFETQAHQGKGFRLAGLLGQGRKGLYDTIYIAQVWSAEDSLMSVEAEMSGEQNDEADKLFASILSSIGPSQYVGSEKDDDNSNAENTAIPVE
ncbi:MAG: hypothetical protein ACRBDL_09600 [Alphaproteobacteria bacterium]